MDSVDSARAEIERQIRHLEDKPGDLETPISLSMDLQILKQSEKPEDRGIADVISGVVDLRSAVGKLEELYSQQAKAIRNIVPELAMQVERADLSSFEGIRVDRNFDRYAMMFDSIDAGLDNKDEDAALRILVVGTMVKEILPWVHEYASIIASEIIVGRRSGEAKSEKIRGFFRIIERSMMGPGIRRSRSLKQDPVLYVEAAHRMLRDHLR